MHVLLLAVLIGGMPFVLAMHFRKSASRLTAAHDVWANVERHARVLLEDRRLDTRAGDLVEMVVNKAGSGTLTRLFLLSFLIRTKPDEGNAVGQAMRALNKEQEHQFLRFMIAILLYDSLRTTFSGVILRRVMYWLATTASDEKAPVSREQVRPMVAVAGKLCHVG